MTTERITKDINKLRNGDVCLAYICGFLVFYYRKLSILLPAEALLYRIKAEYTDHFGKILANAFL